MATQYTKEEMLAKAIERGYETHMSNGAGDWVSMYNPRKKLNLQIWFNTNEFELSHMKGIVLITTTKCGSFMNDDHFKKIQRQINNIVWDLL